MQELANELNKTLIEYKSRYYLCSDELPEEDRVIKGAVEITQIFADTHAMHAIILAGVMLVLRVTGYIFEQSLDSSGRLMAPIEIFAGICAIEWARTTLGIKSIESAKLRNTRTLYYLEQKHTV